MDTVSVLRADAEYYDDALALAKRRLEESPVHEEIRVAQDKERGHYDVVYDLEFSYLKFKRELMRLSPRAIKENLTEARGVGVWGRRGLRVCARVSRRGFCFWWAVDVAAACCWVCFDRACCVGFCLCS